MINDRNIINEPKRINWQIINKLICMQAIDLGLVAMILDNSSAYKNDLIDRCPSFQLYLWQKLIAFI